MKENLLKGTHPGPPQKTEPGVFRCTLWPTTKKKKAEHADYAGVLLLSAGAKAQVLLWVHADDGTLGLRLELVKGKTGKSSLATKPS
jgi:hypothetical protein